MFILFVKDQQKSKSFYESTLDLKPILDVPGMTEFSIGSNILLGLMPEDGIVRILDNKVENVDSSKAIARCELYLSVDNPDEYYDRAIKAGGQGISKGTARNWGDYTAYCSDFDGNIIAFAKKL